MNARQELGREAEAILRAGGFQGAVAKHHGPFWTVYGVYAGNEQSGHTHAQADPQDPRELARTLIARAKAGVVQDIPEAPETVAEAFALGEGPFDPAPEPEQTPQDDGDRETVALSESQGAGADRSDDVEQVDETHGETGEAPQGDPEPNPTISDGSASADSAGDGAVESESGSEGDVLSADDQTIDADYTLPEIELIPPELDPTFGAELLEWEGELVAEPELQPDASGAFIFGDNLDQKRTALAGIVSRIAEERVSAIEAEAAEQPGEYAAVQGFVTTNLDKFTGAFSLQDEPSLAKYHRWAVLDEAHKAAAQVDRHRRDTTREILVMSREQIEGFDPEVGWPA